MNLKDKLIEREKNAKSSSEPEVVEVAQAEETAQDTTVLGEDIDLDLNLDSILDSSANTEPQDDILSGSLETMLETPDVENTPDDIKIDSKTDEAEKEEIVCPHCGGKRYPNSEKFRHKSTCIDYKINGEYPNRVKGEISEPEPVIDDFEPDTYEDEETPLREPENNSELVNNLISLAKKVVLEDIKANYTSKLLTPDALNNLIDAYLKGTEATISHENQVFSSVIDEIISTDYKEGHYKDLTTSILEAVKEEL